MRNVQTLIHTGTVQRHWKCSNWWRALNELLTQRRLAHPAPLEITWIPAHLCEHIPDQKLDEATAAASGSTLLHVLRNRDADRAAKLCAQRIAPVFFHMPQVMGAATALHQEWLVRLHAHLDTGNDDEVKPDHMQAPPQTADSQITLGAAKTMFPIWHWHPHKSHFLWRPKVPALVEMPKRWRYSAKDWSTICNFVRGLRWREDADGAISFCELAVLFHHTGWRFEACSSALQIHEVTCKLRQAFQYLLKDPKVQVCPGEFSATFVKSAGRVLPQSAIIRAFPLIEDQTLVYLARTLCSGCGRTIESWRTPFLSP